jgi:hypothetical protein
MLNQECTITSIEPRWLRSLLDKELALRSLKPINLTGLTGPKWATLFREPGRNQTEDIVVAWLNARFPIR